MSIVAALMQAKLTLGCGDPQRPTPHARCSNLKVVDRARLITEHDSDEVREAKLQLIEQAREPDALFLLCKCGHYRAMGTVVDMLIGLRQKNFPAGEPSD